MHRIVVLGTSGAGKTTVATALAGILDLPYTDLDRVALSGIEGKVTAEEFVARVRQVLGQERWVIDGDYERDRSPGRWTGQRKLGDLVLEHADTAVWLDLPLTVSVGRMWRRTSERVRARSGDAWSIDHLRWLTWEVRSHVRRRFRMRRRLARHANLEIIHLKSQSQVDGWLPLLLGHDARRL